MPLLNVLKILKALRTQRLNVGELMGELENLKHRKPFFGNSARNVLRCERNVSREAFLSERAVRMDA